MKEVLEVIERSYSFSKGHFKHRKDSSNGRHTLAPMPAEHTRHKACLS